jgi:hypothetical protein
MAINKFFVGVQGDSVGFLMPIPTRMSKEDAVEFAAWIIALADPLAEDADSLFHKKLTEVMGS